MKTNKHGLFNPEMLVLAREYRGMTQKDLASISGVTQSQIAQMENGTVSSASEETVSNVLRHLNFPKEFFGLNESKTSFGSSSIFYRKKTRLTAVDRRVIQSKVNLHRIALKRALSIVEFDENTNLPFVDLSDNTPEAAATVVRSSWNMPDGPISNLTKYIENAGIIIIECDFQTNYIDGTTLFTVDAPPIIYINKNLTPDRYRFTLAHELGHLVMHEHHNEQMEEEADSFASELLLPKEQFAPYAMRIADTINLPAISKLKSFWKVSMAAIIERMYRLDFISADKRKNLYIMMNQRKIRQVEPMLFEKEKPRLLQDMLSILCSEVGSAPRDIEKYLSLPSDALQDIYGIIDSPVAWSSQKSPHLRVI